MHVAKALSSIFYTTYSMILWMQWLAAHQAPGLLKNDILAPILAIGHGTIIMNLPSSFGHFPVPDMARPMVHAHTFDYQVQNPLF